MSHLSMCVYVCVLLCVYVCACVCLICLHRRNYLTATSSQVKFTSNENFHNIKNLVKHIMDFSHYIMHTIQHKIKCEQDIMRMTNQMFLFLPSDSFGVP